MILCANCRHEITTTAEKIEIAGGHRHTFANPHGIVFDIGCFRSAPGCRQTGFLIPEFSWFAGYQWQIALCGNCRVHLGWLFVSGRNDAFFHGLILDRLMHFGD